LTRQAFTVLSAELVTKSSPLGSKATLRTETVQVFPIDREQMIWIEARKPSVALRAIALRITRAHLILSRNPHDEVQRSAI